MGDDKEAKKSWNRNNYGDTASCTNPHERCCRQHFPKAGQERNAPPFVSSWYPLLPRQEQLTTRVQKNTHSSLQSYLRNLHGSRLLLQTGPNTVPPFGRWMPLLHPPSVVPQHTRQLVIPFFRALFSFGTLLFCRHHCMQYQELHSCRHKWWWIPASPPHPLHIRVHMHSGHHTYV